MLPFQIVIKINTKQIVVINYYNLKKKRFSGELAALGFLPNLIGYEIGQYLNSPLRSIF